MSGAIVETPSAGEAWATWTEQMEGIRKGLLPLDLTNYNNTSVPQIANGSWAEVAGSIYKFTTNDTITGSLTSSSINYVTLVPSGTGASAIVTPTWSAAAPTWSSSYQGFYSGTTRYVAAEYYDGTNHHAKCIYRNRHCSTSNAWWRVTTLGVMPGMDANWYPGVIKIYATSGSGSGDEIYIPLNAYLREGDIITGMRCECWTRTSGSVTVTMFNSDDNANTTMASVTVNSVAVHTDTSITNDEIDLQQNYGIYAYASASCIMTWGDIEIRIARRERY